MWQNKLCINLRCWYMINTSHFNYLRLSHVAFTSQLELGEKLACYFMKVHRSEDLENYGLERRQPHQPLLWYFWYLSLPVRRAYLSSLALSYMLSASLQLRRISPMICVFVENDERESSQILYVLSAQSPKYCRFILMAFSKENIFHLIILLWVLWIDTEHIPMSFCRLSCLLVCRSVFNAKLLLKFPL